MILFVFKPLFYFVLLVFCSATYDLNDITGNYPYCLTASKERKPSLTKEKSEKSYPLTYLEVLGSNPYGNSDSKLKNILSNNGNNRKDIDKRVNNAKNRLDLMNNANLEHVRLKKSAIRRKDNSHVHISRLENDFVKHNAALTESHDDLLESNDIPLSLTGKARTLTDRFIGLDEKAVRHVNNDGSLNPENAKLQQVPSTINDSKISNEKLLVERVEKRSVHPNHNALMGEKNYRVYQDMTDLHDRAKKGRVSVDHNVCVEHQEGRKKKRIIEREKRMLGRKKKSRKESKKEYQKSEKKIKKKKKNKKLLRKLLKSKKKQSVSYEKGIPEHLTSNNRTRRGVPSKTLLEMISVPLENYLQNVGSKTDETKLVSREIKSKKNELTKENDGQLCDYFTPTKLDLQGNKYLSPSDKLVASTSNFVKWKSNTKQIGDQELKNIDGNKNIKTISIFPTNDFMKIFNNNLNDMSNNLLGKVPENEPKTNYHFEISDIGLKPKEHNSVVYYLNRNVALPSAHKLDALYGTQNSTKKLATCLNSLDNAKEEYHNRGMNEFGGMHNNITGTGSCILTCENMTLEQSPNKNTNESSCEADSEQDRITNGALNCANDVTTTTCNSDKFLTTNSKFTLSHQTVCTYPYPTFNFPKTTAMSCLTLPTNKPTSPCFPALGSESKWNMPSINTTICVNKITFDKCLAEANNNKTLAVPAPNSGCDTYSLAPNNQSSLKVKRETLPLKLLPQLLKNDIEQPIQDGQSKKIFLYLHQVNPKDFTVGTSDKDSQLVGLLKSNPNIEYISKDVNSVKRLLSPSLEFKFPRRKDYPSKDASELMENKLKKRKGKCDCAITIKTSGSTYRTINNSDPACACINPNDPQYTMSPKTLIPNNFILPIKSANLSQPKASTPLRKLSLRTPLVDKTTVPSSSSKSIGSGLYLYNPMYRYSLSAVKNISLRNSASSPITTCSPTTQCQGCRVTTKCPTCALTTLCPTCPTTTKCPTCHAIPGQTKQEYTTTCLTTSKYDTIKSTTHCLPGQKPTTRASDTANPETCSEQKESSPISCSPLNKSDKITTACTTTRKDNTHKTNKDCTAQRRDKISKANTDCTTTGKDKISKANTNCTTIGKDKISKTNTDNVDFTTTGKGKILKNNTDCTTTRKNKISRTNTDCNTTGKDKISKTKTDNSDCTKTREDKISKINRDCTTTGKDKNSKTNTDCNTTGKDKNSKTNTDCTTTGKDKISKTNTDCTTTRKDNISKTNSDKTNKDCSTTNSDKISKTNSDQKDNTNKDCTTTSKDTIPKTNPADKCTISAFGGTSYDAKNSTTSNPKGNNPDNSLHTCTTTTKPTRIISSESNNIDKCIKVIDIKRTNMKDSCPSTTNHLGAHSSKTYANALDVTCKPDCIRDSWEPGENDASCRDDTDLIEYWKEIL